MMDFTNNMFSVAYPAGWIAFEHEDGIGLAIANSDAAMTRFGVGESVPGDLALNIGFIPAAWFAMGEWEDVGIQLEATPDVFLQSIMPMLRLTEAYAEGAVIRDSELVSLSDGVEAGLLTVSYGERVGMLIVFETTEGVFAFVNALGNPAEVEDFQKIALAVAASIEYTDSAENLRDSFFGYES